MSSDAKDLSYLSYRIYNKTGEIVIKKGDILEGAPSGARYEILDFIEDPSGYAGAILKDSSGNIILVHRGTEPDVDLLHDAFITDLMMGIVQLNNQVPAAEKLLLKAQAFATDSGGTLTMTGHSLGGAITQILAAKHQVQGVTFNAYGAVGVNDTPEGGEGLVTNYVRATDIVGTMGVHFGSVVKYATASDISASIVPLKTQEALTFATHDIRTFFGSGSIMSDENRERYRQSAYGYEFYADYLRAQIKMTKVGAFVISPITFVSASRWFRNVYDSAATGQAFLGSGENDVFSGTATRDFAAGGNGVDNLSGGGDDDFINGNDGNDILRGDAGSDMLYGEADDDYLDGGSGSDYLNGGTGHDRYNFSLADFQAVNGSTDTVVDADGIGQIEIDNVALSIGKRTSATTWESLDGAFVILADPGLADNQTLTIKHKETGATILVQNWVNGALGISLGGQVTTPEAVALTGQEDAFVNIQDWNSVDVINALGGNDGLSGNYGDDILDGGAGDDLILGGSGDDKLYGGDGNDVISDFSSRISIFEWDDERVVHDGMTEKAFQESRIAELGTAVFSRGNSWFVYRDGDVYSMAGVGFEVPSNRTDPNLHPGGNDFIDGGAGNDLIAAGEGDDTILGGEGDDTIYGGHDDDVISGGAGNDVIEGDVPFTEDPNVYAVSDAAKFNGNDVIDGGAGDDIIRGQGGNDVIYGSTGDDILRGRGEERAVDSDDLDADYIDGGEGNDQISGDDGNDTLLGGAGADTIRGDQETAQTRSGNDYIDGGDGDDVLFGDGGSDTILGGSGADQIQGDAVGLDASKHGNDLLSGGDGNDIIAGQGGDDILMGDDGDDQLIGDADVSQLALAYHGDDQLFGGAGNDLLWGGGGNDTLSGGVGNDQMDGEQGDDTLSGGEGDDRLMGGLGNDVLAGDAGDDALSGGEGDDTLSGGGGVDLLDGGSGNDTLDGDAGSDTLDGDEGNDALFGGDGNDALYGGEGDDVLAGGAGNDGLAGAQGNDRYEFGLNWGVDSIQGLAAADAGVDTIVFAEGILPDEIGVTADAAGNVVLAHVNGIDALVLQGFLRGAAVMHRIEFSDGTVWTLATLLDKLAPSMGGGVGDAGDNLMVGSKALPTILYGELGNDILVGGAGSDTLYGGMNAPDQGGGADNDSIFGGGGNDRVYGESGDDCLDGGAGNDLLDGGDGADQLYGGEGDDTLNAGWTTSASGLVLHETANDLLVGGAGNDEMSASLGVNTYYFEVGFGQDRIFLTQASAYEINVLGLHSERAVLRFSKDIAAADLTLLRSGDDLLIGHGDNWVTISGYASRGDAMVEMVFDDGSTLSPSQLEVLNPPGVNTMGGAGDDFMQGTEGNDTLQGLGGNDTLSGGAGADKLYGGTGSDAIHGGFGDDILDGGDGEDFLYGEEGNDVFMGVQRTDHAFGGSGDDTYYFLSDSMTGASKADADSVVTELLNEGNDTVVTNFYNFTLAPSGVENIVVRHVGYLYTDAGGKLIERTIVGNALDNTIQVVGDPLIPGARIVLDGGAGNDRLIGSTGDEIYIVDSAGDEIVEPEASHSNDTVRAACSWSLENHPSLENIELTTDNTTATGSSGNNRLDGTMAAGTNTLIGGAGDDTYIVDSNDIVVEEANGGTDTVVIKKFAPGTTLFTAPSGASQIEIYQLHKDAGTGVGIVGSEGNDILIGNDKANSLNGGAGDDVLRSGGSEYQRSDSLYGGEGNDLLISDYGYHAYLNGGLGNDELRVGAGTTSESIRYDRGDGSDVIVSLDGSNYGTCSLTFGPSINPGNAIWSREGNDLLITFSDSVGDQVRVKGYWMQSNGTDVLTGVVDKFSFWNEPFSRSGLTLEALRNKPPVRNYSTLDASVPNGQAFTYTLPVDAFSDENVESLVYAVEGLPAWLSFDPLTRTLQGTPPLGQADQDYQVTATDLYGAAAYLTLHVAFVNTIEGTSGNDSLLGTSGVDMLVGGAGNDTLNGGASGDRLIGGTGNDTYIVDNGNDQVIEALNEGDDLVNASVSYALSDNVERLTLTGSASEGAGNDLDNIITGNGSANYLYGNEGNDTLTGNNGNDELYGGSGNDTLDGGSGNDYMSGDEGNDTYIVDSAGDQVEEWDSSGTDTVKSSITYTLGYGVENLVLTGSSGLTGNGNELDNVLTGNSGANTLRGYEGNDTLDGGAGNDTMLGGVGDDTYVVNATGDIVTELANEGADLVQSAVTYTLGSNIENLVLTGTAAINGTGNTLDNLLTGNSGANSLTGGAGNDTLNGAAGTDTLTGGTGADVYLHGRGYGADTVVENDATAGTVDVAKFLSGVAYDQLWFVRPSGTNNLEISIIGSSDKLTIKDWYKGSQYQVEEIRTTDGNYLLTAAKVQALVTKMATMAKPTTTTLTTAQRSQLDPVFATTWVQQAPPAGLMAMGNAFDAAGIMAVGGALQGTGSPEAIMPGGCYPQTPGDWRDRVGGHIPDSRIKTWLEAHGYASIEDWLDARSSSEHSSGNWPEQFQDRRYVSISGMDELYGSLADVMTNDRLGLADQDRTMSGPRADVAVECQRLIGAMSLADAPDLSLAANCEVWRNRLGVEVAMF